MSIKLMSEIWKCEFSPSILILVLSLADFASDDGQRIYPSKRLLSWKTGYSIRQVQRMLRKLEADGILKVIKPATNIFSTVYEMDLTKCTRKLAYVARKK